MAEEIYYADYNVKITSDWARLGQQVYQVADIGAVAVQTAQPKPPRTGLWKWIPNLAKLALAIATMNLVILTLRSEEHTSELQSPMYLVCRLLLEKKKK